MFKLPWTDSSRQSHYKISYVRRNSVYPGECFAVKARRNTYAAGAINHSRGVLHGSYKKLTPLRCPTGTILHGENVVVQRNRNDFPKVSFTLDVI
jgi:hypothetical protein